MIKKDNFGTRSNSKLAASGPIKAGTTNANLGGKSVVARSNTPAQDPNLGRLILTTISQDIPKYSIDGEGNQVAINYTSLQIPKEKELRHPLVAGIQVSLVSGNFSQLITITSTLALNDTTISVASFNPNVDIGKGALICIDEEDLFNQYQNKTKGTIAGFTVDADGIAKSGIEVTDWLNSDTMTGASVNNVPTALSVKNYVDNSHPAEDQTLQEVTDNGNTTTNDIILSNNNVLRSSNSNRFIQIQDGNSQMIFSSYGAHIHKTYDNVSYAERMRLTRFGNLGIGTSSPSGKLHVSDVADFFTDLDGSDSALVLKESGGNAWRFGNKSADDSFNITQNETSLSSSVRFTIANGGNVGIGTSSPEEKISVSGSIQLINQQEITWADIGDGNTGRVAIRGNEDADWIMFKTDNSERMRLTNTGLGIGTSSPTHALQIEDGFTLSAIGFLGTSLKLGNYNSIGYNRIWSDGTNMSYSNNNGYHKWSNQNTEQMRLTSTGYLGIGTSSPTEKLEVNEGYILSSGSGTSHGFELNRTGSDTYQIRHLDGGLTINNATDGRKEMTFDGDGNVGIGTSSPTEKLHVVGDSLVTGDSHADAFKPDGTGEPIKFKNFASTELVRITDAGIVGIGTTSPNRLLTLSASGGTYQAFNSTSNNNTTIGSDGTGAFIVYDDTASSYRMVVKASTGNVLIGTTTDSSARLKSLSADGNSFSLMLGRADTNNLWRFNHAGNDLRIYNQATSGSNIILGADAGGIAEANNVLIGTGTDNGDKLQVAGTASFVNSRNGQIDITRTSGANTFIQSQSATGVIGTSTNHRLDIKTNGTTRATLTTAGRLGLGVTSPSVPLHISNDAPAIRLQDLTSSDNHYLTGNNGEFRIQSTGYITMRPNNTVSVTFNENGTTTFGGQITIPATPVATTDAASKSYVDSQVAEAGTSSFGSFTPTSTQSIASGGNVGVKSTLLLATSQVTASNITTSSAGLTFANAGLYQISFNFASKVSGTANRTLAAANLEYSTDGESWTEIVGSLVYNYDRGTATSGGASSWGFVYDGSASCSFIHNLATSSKIRARFWIEGRASSASGITTIINGCRLSAHKIG